MLTDVFRARSFHGSVQGLAPSDIPGGQLPQVSRRGVEFARIRLFGGTEEEGVHDAAVCRGMQTSCSSLFVVVT